MKKTLALTTMTALALVKTGAAENRIQYNMEDAAAAANKDANTFSWTFSGKTSRAAGTADASTPVASAPVSNWNTDGTNKITGTMYDQDGYDKDGFNEDGINKDTGTAYDAGGFNRDGINKDTGTAYNAEGFNSDGLTENGTPYNDAGFDAMGMNENGTPYDDNGFDVGGIAQDGSIYNDEGYNVYGYDEFGDDQSGNSFCDDGEEYVEPQTYTTTVYMMNNNGEWSTATRTYVSEPSCEGGGACYTGDTPITLADGSTKRADEITYEDELLVWNFDEGHFDKAKPIWIKITEKNTYCEAVKFSDGSLLKISGGSQHRIFCKEAGKFVYPATEDMPIGSHTLNNKGEYVELLSRESVQGDVLIYNIVTERHMNCFVGGIMGSCRLNNIYPIKDLKFVKDNREPISYENYAGLDRMWYDGLRLAEQPQEINHKNDVDLGVSSVKEYVERMIRMMAKNESLYLKAC